MSDLDLLYTEIEQDLRSSVRDLLAEWCDSYAVTRIYDGDRSLVDGLWKSLADIGLAGLLVSEDRGAQGASAREAAVVLEELGRTAAPVPFLTSSVIATTALLDSDSTLVEQLATGERVAALAVPWSTAPDVELPAVRLEGDRLTGTITSVAGAIEADVLLVAAGSGLCAVDVSAVTVTPRVCLDMTRQLADVTLDGVTAALVLADAEPAVRRALDWGAALMASEQLGLARWAPGDDGGLPQGAQAVRPGPRRVPGAQAPARRPLHRRGVRCSGGTLRRGYVGRGRPGCDGGGVDRPGIQQ
jgi:alkylation response protein AidB-like acyl-CoA dehydrogenase